MKRGLLLVAYFFFTANSWLAVKMKGHLQCSLATLTGHIHFFDGLECSRRAKSVAKSVSNGAEERLCVRAVLSIVELGELSDGRSVQGLADAALFADAASPVTAGPFGHNCCPYGCSLLLTALLM